MTQSGYFRLATTVMLGIGITYEKLLFCRGISEESRENKFSMREYRDRTFCECFNNPFPDDFVSLSLKIPHILVDDSPYPNKISQYTPGLLPDTIYAASVKSVINLTTPYDLPQIIV